MSKKFTQLDLSDGDSTPPKKKFAKTSVKTEEDPWYMDAYQGLQSSAMDTILGLEDMLGFSFGDVETSSEFKQQYLKELEDDAMESGWGTVGKIGGDILQMAVPGGAVARGVKAAGKGKGALLAAESLLAGAYGGTQMPEGDETRLGNAATDALLTAGAGTALEAIGKSARGFQKTPEAQKLMDKGVYLTPGQAAPNLSGIEGFMRFLPFTAQPTMALRKEGQKGARQIAYQLATPSGIRPPVGKDGFEATRYLDNAIKGKYTEAWSEGAEALRPKFLSDVINDASEIGKTLPKKDANKLKNIIGDFSKETSKGKNIDEIALSRMDQDLRDAAFKSKSNSADRKLRSLSDTIRSRLPEQTKSTLDDLDSNFSAFKTVKKASKAAKKNKGQFSMKQLNTADSQVAGDKAGLGITPFQDLLDLSQDTLMRSDDGAPISALRQFIDRVRGPTGIMKYMGQAALGDRPSQQLAKRLYDKGPTISSRNIAGGSSDLKFGPRQLIDSTRGKLFLLDELLNPTGNERYE